MPLFSARPEPAGPEDLELAASGVPETSPTWELELLISGAVLFALFQLPSLLDGVFRHIEPHVTQGIASALFLIQLYVRAIVYALIASFVVHLVARAYWVGLVGLNSVFPGGVKWEEVRSGPVGLDVMRTRLATLPAAIARTDNFCSVIFSFAFLLVLFFAFSIFFTGGMSFVSWGLATLFSGGRNARYYFFALIILFALFPAVVLQFDRRAGGRLPSDSWQGRALRAGQTAAFFMSFLWLTGPIFLTLMSNIGRKKLLPIFFTAFMSLLVVVAANRLASKGTLTVNGYDYFATSAAHGVDYRFYENQRDADDVFPRTPSIQSDVIRDPYIKLFVPYSPSRHNVLIASTCPGVKPLQSRGLQLGAEQPAPDSLTLPVLRCLATIHAVTLNGAPLTTLDFSFYEHPGTGIKGVIAYIPTDGLPRGRNVLIVRAVPAVGDDAPKSPPAPWVIPFWI